MKLKFTGRKKEDGTVVHGNGLLDAEGKVYILDGEARTEINPGTLRVENSYYPDLEKMKNVDMTHEQLYSLHEILVNDTIKFLKENEISSVDGISLGIDAIQPSTEFGEWTCFTDSSLSAYGIEDGVIKFIDESL